MDAAGALDEAFRSGLKVRGDEARAVAAASLVMHASRTLDPAPFLERGESLVEPALESYRKAGRQDLEVRVGMWMADGGRQVDLSSPATDVVGAYAKARLWSRGQGGPENLLWIRGVPRDEALAALFFERLLDHALAAGEGAHVPAQAVLEAALADFPRPSTYGLIFRAAALAAAPEVIDRTLEGLGSTHPAHDKPADRKLLESLRAALGVERLEASRTALEVAVHERRDEIIQRGLAPHMAAALGRKLMETHARDLIADARPVSSAAGKVCAAYVERQLDGPRGERLGLARRLLASKEPPSAPALVEGACEAARAVRDAWPAVDVAQALTGDSLGPLSTAATRATTQKELFAAGGEAAAASGDRAAVEGLARTLRAGGLAPGAQTFLRAALADAAAGVAARAGDPKAFDLAQKLAGQTRDKFERAKMMGRAAMEYVRATEVPPMPVRWLDPLFRTAYVQTYAESSGAR